MRLPTKLLFGIMCAGIVAAYSANAMAIDSAVINLRFYNDDPGSTLTTTNSYPTKVEISDTTSIDVGFANAHNFHLADAGAEHVFANDEPFSFSADLTIDGDGEGEAGLQVAPWYGQGADGTFNFRTTDGEIAVFGGALPFYSFTTSHLLTYTKGETVRVGVVYSPHSLSMANPATITYNLNKGGTDYTSGPLAFGEGNPAEDPPYGLWGHLNEARVGGHMKLFISGSGGVGKNLTTTWENMSYSLPEPTSMVLAGLGLVGLVALRRRGR